MNLEHPFFKKQRSIKAFKAFRDESSLAYHAQKDDPAVAELDAALMSCPDELAGAAPYLRAGRSLNVGACCVVAQYEAKIVTARCISGADIPATPLFSAEKVAAIRSDPELQHDADEARKMAGAAKIALDDAQRQLAEAEADVEEKCAEAEARPTPASEAQKILDGEVAQTMELLQKSIAARNELYAAGIIFGKYQNAVALSSFYEYLMSGRCEKLEGTNGAYNLYESEVRANRVIEQLDTVIDSLNQIKANQYMMYSAMCSMKQELTQLNDTMNSALSAIYNIENSASDAVIQLEGISQIGTTIAKNSDVIAHNTAATAYYAEKNAELTNAMGYLVALR